MYGCTLNYIFGKVDYLYNLCYYIRDTPLVFVEGIYTLWVIISTINTLI